MGRHAGDLEAHREHALGLDADVQVGGLAGDREVGGEAVVDEGVGRAALDVLGLLVGHADEAHADRVLPAASLRAHIIAASAPFMS